MNPFIANNGGGVIVIPPPVFELENALIKCHGNSLTSGIGASASENYYPAKLQALLDAEFSGVEVENHGTPAIQTPALIAEAGSVIDPIEEGRPNYDIIWEGSNHIDLGGVSASTAIASLQTYCQARKAAGWAVVLCTLTNRVTNGALTTAEVKSRYATVNAYLAANYSSMGIDFLVRLDLDARLMDEDDTTYFNGDKTHLNDAGYEVVAENIFNVLIAV